MYEIWVGRSDTPCNARRTLQAARKEVADIMTRYQSDIYIMRGTRVVERWYRGVCYASERDKGK